jgi:hypothetical protein
MKSMLTPDITAKKKAILEQKTVETRVKMHERLMEQVGQDTMIAKSINQRNEVLKDVADKHRSLINNKKEPLRKIQENRSELNKLVSYCLSDIVLESLPLDQDVIVELKSSIERNAFNFFFSILDENLININSFLKSSTSDTNNLILSLIQGDKSEVNRIKEEVADTVKSKAESSIKKEIKLAQENKERLDEMEETAKELKAKEEDDTVKEAYGFLPKMRRTAHTKKNLSNSTFSTILRESVRKTIKNFNTLNMDTAIGEATIGYNILETLNTLNLVNDKNKDKILEIICKF